jgi:hypothetical protein
MPDPNALTPILAALNAALGGRSQIILTSLLVPAGPVRVFLDGLPARQLPLTGAAITADDAANPTTVAVTGRQAGPWTIPNIAHVTLSDIDVRLNLQIESGTGSVSTTFTVLGATIGSVQNQILLSGSLQSDATLALQVAAANHSTPVVALADVVAVLTSSASVSLAVSALPLFQSIPIGGVDLRFGYVANTTTVVTLSAQLNATWSIIDNGAFALAHPSVSVHAECGPPDADGVPAIEYAVRLSAETMIASAQFGVFVDIGDADALTVEVVPANGQLVPGLLDIATAAGGAALHDAVQSAVQTIGLGDLNVDGITIGFSVSARKLTQITLAGHMTLGGGRVDLTMQLLPDFVFTGSLPMPGHGRPALASGISVNALATQVLGDAADLPHIDVTELSLFAYPHLGTYRLFITTTEDWAWDLSGHGTGPTLTLQQFGFHAERSPQGVSGGIYVAVALGGFDISLSADYRGRGNGWLLKGDGAQPGDGVPLGDFVRDVAGKIGATVPDALLQAVESLRIVIVALTVDTQAKAFSFIAETQTKGQIPFGLKTYEVDLRVGLDVTADPATGQRSVSGHLEADLDIGGATFTLTFDFGTVKVVKGTWRQADGSALDFRDIITAIGIDDPVVVPDGLDLGLKSAAFEYHSDAQSFTLSAESNLFGDAFLTMGKGTDGRWGVVFGVDSPKPGKLSDLPAIGGELHPVDFIVFEQASILIASNTFQNFSVPPLPALPPPSTASSTVQSRSIVGRTIAPIASGNVLQLAEGLSLAAMLDFAQGSTDRRMANLRSIVGQSKLLLQAAISPGGVSLFIGLAGKIYIPAGSGRLALANPTIRIDAAPLISFQVSGGLQFSVEGTPVTATARLILSETEAQVAVSVAADQGALPPPPGVRGLHLEQFGIAMGVFFEPPGLDLGLQGKFRIGQEQAARADQFAFVLEMIGEVPNPLYLSFYIDKLDFGQVLTLFTDRTEPAVVGALEIVKASNLSFHWAETQVVLPDGSVATPGFGFSANVQILTFGAHAELEVSIAQGIFGHAEMSPIDLRGVLQVSGDGKGIVRTYEQVGGQWAEVTNNAIVRRLPPPPIRRETIVPPGGPIIEFNALRSPFVHVNWRITLFDLVRETVDVTISSNGFTFALSYSVANIARFDLHCLLAGADHFTGSASLAIHLDAMIGPIHYLGVDVGSLHLITSLNAVLGVTLDPSRFNLSLAGGFSFEGLTLTMPSVDVGVAPRSLAELPNIALQAIRGAADQIFASLFANAAKWADMIGRGIVSGVADMAGPLKNAYKVSADEAARLMRVGKQSADAVAAGLKTAYNETAQAAAASMKAVGFSADEVASGLKTGFGLAADGVATAMRAVGFAADQAAGGLRSAYGETVQGGVLVLKRAGYAANEVGGALRDVFGQSADQAAKLLHGAGFAADQVARTLQSVYGQTAQNVTRLLHDAGFTADQIGDALKSVFGLGANATAQFLRAAGFGVNDIGNALRIDWGANAQDVAAALRGAGFAVDQVGSFVKNAFNLGPDALKGVLQGVGFAGDQIKGFFDSLGGAFAQTFQDIGHKLDPTHW